MLNDKEIRQLMKDIFRSVEIKYPEFAFRVLKNALKQVHLEGIEQGKFEGILEEKKRSIQVVDVNQEVKEIKNKIITLALKALKDICDIIIVRNKDKIVNLEATKKKNYTIRIKFLKKQNRELDSLIAIFASDFSRDYDLFLGVEKSKW